MLLITFLTCRKVSDPQVLWCCVRIESPTDNGKSSALEKNIQSDEAKLKFDLQKKGGKILTPMLVLNILALRHASKKSDGPEKNNRNVL